MVLSVEDMTVTYRTRRGSNVVVDNMNLEIGDAEFVGLVGESGSGKSAAIHAIARLPRPVESTVAGQIHLSGVDMLAARGEQLRQLRGTTLGFVGQNPFGSLHPTLRISRQFHNVLRAHRKTSSKSESFRLAKEALDSVGIVAVDKVLNGYAHQLSGGMAQRVVIAMATMLGPKLLIADEPTTALDPTVQVQILDLLARLRDEMHTSVLIVTHDLGVIANYCDHALVMKSGSVVEQSSVSTLFTDPTHQYTRELFADDFELRESV
ncbi:ABC transporter ATP-binding protein [Amycolatopsis balhimycina]|nr:ABC transporter ATP-binding protein [Amycolatopsis balhimycina]